MSQLIKFSKEFVKTLTETGDKYFSKRFEYYHIPSWFKKTEKVNVLEVCGFKELPPDVIQAVFGLRIGDRYPMCKEQPVQLDCRRVKCKYHKKGKCLNIAPAITIIEDKATCWTELAE